MHDCTSSRPSQLRFAPHIRACYCNGEVILLDLRACRYTRLAGRHLHVLGSQIVDFPNIPPPPVAATRTPDIGPVIRTLIAQGLLTEQTLDAPGEIRFERPARSLDYEATSAEVRIGAARIGHFVQCAAVTAMLLRWRSLSSIVQAVSAQKDGLRATGRQAPLTEALVNAASVYDRLRPFLFTARDRCLHDSLTLMRFLVIEGVCAEWFIGVKTQPFGAHSWVQSGGTVLNDQHEHVLQFTPILMV